MCFGRMFFLFSLLVLSSSLFAQKTEIQGIVKDSVSSEPIEGLVVQALEGSKMLTYAVTDIEGGYTLRFESLTAEILVTFKHLAYTQKTTKIVNKSQQLNVNLSAEQTKLREVVVVAPQVRQKKDTTAFNVASFEGINDRSIEDVIKKLPGIEVSDNGRISFQGKDISRLNINGLDMLGGKYTIATKNMEPKRVATIEIIDNYQEVKQLRGKEYSDKVAMNLKLKKDATIKPVGNVELGTGASSEELLYHAGVNAMAFKSDYQFLGVIKANNLGTSLRPEFSNQFGNQSVNNTAKSLFSGNLGTHPPIASKLFWRKKEIISSLNSIIKLNDDKTIKIGIDFLRDKSFYNSSSSSNYFVNGKHLTLHEDLNPNYEEKKIQGDVEYKINSDNIYLKNNTLFGSNLNDNHLFLLSDRDEIQQLKNDKLHYLKNVLSMLKKTKRREYSLFSSLSYSTLPTNKLEFVGVKNVNGDFFQTSVGNTFNTRNWLSLSYDVGKLSKLSMKVGIDGDFDSIKTNLQKNDTTFVNHNYGHKLINSISPSYTRYSPKQQYEIRLSMPIELYNINFKNDGISKSFQFSKLFINPSITGNLIFTPKLKMELTGDLNHSIGDITEFILQPIQISYHQQQVRSGILAQNRSGSGSIKLFYKNPIKMLFVDGSVSYNHNLRNTISNQKFEKNHSNIGITTTDIANENTSQGFSLSAHVSKKIRSINTFFSVRTNYGISHSENLRENVITDITNSYFSISPNINSDISKKINISYSASYKTNTLAFKNKSTTYLQHSHRIYFSYKLMKNIIFSSKWDYNKYELSPKNYKNMHLFDSSLRYKKSNFEMELSLNNLFNLKEYAYTIFSETDQFSYRYKLRPREITMTTKISF